MVVPSFSALLAYSSGKVTCNQAPVLWTMLIYHVKDYLVFFLCPWSFCKSRIQNFLPAMQALNVGSPCKLSCNGFPLLSSMLLYKSS